MFELRAEATATINRHHVANRPSPCSVPIELEQFALAAFAGHCVAVPRAVGSRHVHCTMALLTPLLVLVAAYQRPNASSTPPEASP
jgi:hypothetical protein